MKIDIDKYQGVQLFNIVSQRTRINSIPALLCFSGKIEDAVARGTILFYHGLWASKDMNEKELKDLAGYGFLAVGIDAVGHGERYDPLMKERFSEELFVEMIIQNVGEIPGIIDCLIELNLAEPDRIGICGISMGGYLCYAGVLADPRIKVATPVLGSPRWDFHRHESPENRPEQFYPTALLAQNAGRDESVSPEHSRDFYYRLKPFYKDNSERLCYMEYPDSGHFMLEGDWNFLWNNVLDWFDRFLVR